MNSARRHAQKRFGEYLVRLREDAGFTQAEAATRLGLSRQQLNYFEKGTRSPSDALLVKFARVYHIATAEVQERAYWPQLVLLPLIAIVDPEQLTKDFIEELEKGLEDAERDELTKHVKELLQKRLPVANR